MVLSPSWRAVFGVFLIFAFGCLSGSITTSLIYQHGRMDFLRHGPELAFEKGLTKDLALRSDQAQAVHQLFIDNFTERRIFQRELQPRIQRANLDTFHQIRLLLDPDQQVQFDRNIAEFRHRLQTQLAHNREHPGGPLDPFAPGPPHRDPGMPPPPDGPPGMAPSGGPPGSNASAIEVPPVPTPTP